MATPPTLRHRLGRALAWTLGAVLVALVGLVVFAWIMRPRDPTQGGRPLTSWMADLGSLDTSVRAAATNAIRNLDTNALPALTRHLGTRDSSLGRTAIDAQRYLPRELWVWAMRLTAPRAGIERRWQAATALGLLGAQAAPAVPALSQALRDADPRVRAAAIETLRGIRPSGLEAIVSAMGTTNQTLFANLCSAIGRCGPDAAMVATQLARVVPNTPSSWQNHLRAALAAASAPAVEPLAGVLGSDEAAARELAIEALQAMTLQDFASLRAVIALLKDSDPRIRRGAARVLSGRTFWERRAMRALAGALSDPDATVRLEVVAALSTAAEWSNQATNAVPALETFIATASAAEREAAQAALDRIAAIER